VPGAILVLDLAAVGGRFDAGSVERLARAALAARRHGWALRITGAPPGLVELIELMGLRAVLLGPSG
jgi:ABC-type transporter Mla MlaB component